MTLKVGFIGLGIMGKPMSKNLIKAGYSLVVLDRNSDAVAEVIAAGAETATTAKAIAEQCDVIITMLPNSPHVKEVALGENGIIDGAKPGLVVIDMSSIAPLASREISEALKAKGVEMLDAPVSGGEPKAIDGTLSVMVGGDKAVFDKYYDLMKAMAGSVVHTGEIGAGNVTKLANQVIVALNIAAMSEALTLATKAGVNPDLVYQAIRGGLAGSTVLDAKAPMVMDRNFKPGFRIDLHIKDLANALDTSHGVGAQLPLTAAVMEMMQALGARFTDANGTEIGYGGGSLMALNRIDISDLDPRLQGCAIRVACDVTNPLVGESGASRIFGPQKGATEEMILELDASLSHYANVIKKSLRIDVNPVPGAGAAGGMGAALMAFLGAELKSGIEIVTQALNLEEHIHDCTWVLTGEGRIDSQSINGKVPVGVASVAKKYHKPVIGIAGSLTQDVGVVHQYGIDAVFSVLTRIGSLEEAFQGAYDNIYRASRNIAATLQVGMRSQG